MRTYQIINPKTGEKFEQSAATPQNAVQRFSSQHPKPKFGVFQLMYKGVFQLTFSIGSTQPQDIEEKLAKKLAAIEKGKQTRAANKAKKLEANKVK